MSLKGIDRVVYNIWDPIGGAGLLALQQAGVR
jgi:hypothetical protein